MISNSEITAMPDYSDPELLKLARKAIAEIMVGGQSAGVNGKQLTRADLPKLWDTVRELEGRIGAAAASDSPFDGTALIQWGQ